MATITKVEQLWWFWYKNNTRENLVKKIDKNDLADAANIVKKIPCIALGYKLTTTLMVGNAHNYEVTEVTKATLLYSRGLHLPYRAVQDISGWNLVNYDTINKKIIGTKAIPLVGDFPQELKMQTDLKITRSYIEEFKVNKEG